MSGGCGSAGGADVVTEISVLHSCEIVEVDRYLVRANNRAAATSDATNGRCTTNRADSAITSPPIHEHHHQSCPSRARGVERKQPDRQLVRGPGTVAAHRRGARRPAAKGAG